MFIYVFFFNYRKKDILVPHFEASSVDCESKLKFQHFTERVPLEFNYIKIKFF